MQMYNQLTYRDPLSLDKGSDRVVWRCIVKWHAAAEYEEELLLDSNWIVATCRVRMDYVLAQYHFCWFSP